MHVLHAPAAHHELDRQPVQKLGVGFVASAITHPVLWAVVQPGAGERVGDRLRFVGSDLAYNTVLVYWSAVAIAEAFAIVVEAIYLWSVGVRR